MRLERDDGRNETAVVCGLNDALKQRAVPRVNSVEIADGNRRRAFQKGVGRSSKDVHADREKKIKKSIGRLWHDNGVPLFVSSLPLRASEAVFAGFRPARTRTTVFAVGEKRARSEERRA